MKRALILLTFIYFSLCSLFAHEYEYVKGWVKPSGEYPGDGHGEIAVSENGEVYLSVGGKGETAGIQVYDGEGHYLRNVPNAPNDFHGFSIVKEGTEEFIYGSRVSNGEILKMSLTGEVVLTIKTLGTPVEEFFAVNPKTGKKMVLLTSVTALPNGEIFVVDGYGNDHILRFNQKGEFLGQFGGRQKAPLNLLNCHKIYLDYRYGEPRLLLCDRVNNRLLHTTLKGELIGEYVKDLRRPSAAAFHNGFVAIAEINGRISVFDKSGKMVSEVGVNNSKEVGNNTNAPETWTEGIVNSPHGIAYDAEGNILMTEFNQWGRVLKYDISTTIKK